MSALSFRIQEIGNAFSPQVVALILPIQQLEFGVPVTIADQPDLLDIEGTYQRSGGNFWGAFYQDELIGTIGLIRFREGAAIRKMFVRKEYRGKSGVAQALLEELIRFSLSIGLSDLYLGTVEVLKAAHRFYEKNGFTYISGSELPPHFPKLAVDTLFFHLALERNRNDNH
jgi:GNAT superfamily N-acetyltransferase